MKQLADLVPMVLISIGTALPSIISALCNASSVTITDHPSSPALTTGAIQANVAKNLPKASTGTEVLVRGYVWGTDTMYAVDAYGKVAGELGRYDMIVLADCLWMPSEHANLVRTIRRALDERSGCCAIVVGGFHTGRGIVRDFFDVATGEADRDCVDGEDEVESMRVVEVERRQQLPRLNVKEIYEIDVNGQRRDWQKARPEEGKEEAKRWCVVAILVPP